MCRDLRMLLRRPLFRMPHTEKTRSTCAWDAGAYKISSATDASKGQQLALDCQNANASIAVVADTVWCCSSVMYGECCSSAYVLTAGVTAVDSASFVVVTNNGNNPDCYYYRCFDGSRFSYHLVNVM